MRRVHVIPTSPDSFRVPHRSGPDGRNAKLRPEGEVVAWSPFWARRLRDGDITTSEPTSAPKED